MAKDVNIHVKAKGTEQTKQQLNKVGKSVKGTGEQVTTTGKKLSGMGRILTTLKTQVMGFVGAWLGLQAVQKLITWLIAKLERIAQLQKEIYEKSLSFAQIGQALEFQTGTRGMQQHWAQQAIQLQAAGGLVSPAAAQQMMISMDIAFAKQGGIKSPEIRALGKQLAPFVGAGGLGPEAVGKLFEFAGTAGIAPTEEAYKQYFAQLHAAYTTSKAQDFSQFMIGLQRGGAPYMAMGGTLEEALSAFVGARAVMPNEALAATMVEQIARLSGGAYEKPRQAMERKLGVSWSDMTMGQRMNTLLQYVGDIPEAQRQQVLVRQGFPVELTSRIGMMVTPEAMGVMAATRQQVAAVTPTTVTALTDAYMKSMLAQERVTGAGIAEKQLKAGPAFASWQRRLRRARRAHEIDVAFEEDRPILDRLEPYVMAMEEMREELDVLIPTLPEGKRRQKAEQFRNLLFGRVSGFNVPGAGLLMPTAELEQEAFRYERRLQIIINDGSTNYNRYGNPEVQEIGPRAIAE